MNTNLYNDFNNVNLSVRTLNTLKQHGINNYKELQKISIKDILKIQGKKTRQELISYKEGK